MNPVFQLARLNAKVASLAVRGRWLGNAEIAASYDRVAATYDHSWHCHLRSVTNDFLRRLPWHLPGALLDLGAGTGYCARYLARNNPDANIIAVDISMEMLALAACDAPPNLRFANDDMLDYIESWEGGPVSLILSTWALGYSHPARLIKSCGRLLQEAGLLAFIVNYRDTLAPVFRAYQRSMLRFPERVRLAAVPRFPRNWTDLERALEKSGFDVAWHEEGWKHIPPPESPLLPWLLQTGILAGFEGMLDLTGPAAAYFEDELAPQRDSIFHHFTMAIARKR